MEEVLFVCTGNLCRSPIAEALLRARLHERDVDGVVISSAGTMGFSSAATSEARAVAAERGGDLSEHRARRLDRGIIEAADLVIGMTADHVIDLVYQAPDAAARIFKLAELARLAPSGPRRRPEQTLRAWAESLAAERSERPWADSNGDPDVADPMGDTLEVYRATADEIAVLLDSVVDAAWPAPASEE